MIYGPEKEGWILLASVDESEPYEVDENHVLYNPTTRKFMLRAASGCSCWDGEYDETEYDSIDAIEKEIVLTATDKQYAPTLAGAQTLLAEAREAFAKVKA